MRRWLIGMALALFLSGEARADLVIPAVTYPNLPGEGATPEAFVPQGWKLEAQHKGDLNKDSKDDLVIVLRMNEPKNVIANDGLGVNPFDTNPRILAVAFGAAAGQPFRLALQNHTLIARTEDPVLEDPLSEGDVAIERGTLSVTLHLFSSAGSWAAGTTTYRFRHGKRGFELIGFDRSMADRGSGDIKEVSINYLTGKVQIGTGTISDDKLKTTWRKLKKKPLLLIDEIGDGLAFEPKY